MHLVCRNGEGVKRETNTLGPTIARFDVYFLCSQLGGHLVVCFDPLSEWKCQQEFIFQRLGRYTRRLDMYRGHSPLADFSTLGYYLLPLASDVHPCYWMFRSTVRIKLPTGIYFSGIEYAHSEDQ